MSRLRRTGSALAAGVVLTTLATVPAHGAAPGYVALGDSYSSGTGTRSYVNDGTRCQRSIYAYPALIANSLGYSLNFRACSGATISDVADLQLSVLGAGTRYVTITAGGNDAGFAAVLTECAKPAWASNCNAAIDQAQNLINSQVPARLATLYSAIGRNAPGARVVAGGYPRIFNGEDCNAFTWFSPAEEVRLNATADLLNAKIAAAANRPGFVYSPTAAFVGHAVCDNTEWLNGLSNPTVESFHPNRLGHSAGYTALIGTALTGSTVRVGTVTTQVAADRAARLAAQQRPYAAQDRGIRPERFMIPDLRSAQVRRAAARAGVDLSSRASIDRIDARYAARQARANR
jgi:lysophospholipase L1-like esterase